MARVAFTDEAMWVFMGVVVCTGEGTPRACGPEPPRALMDMELAGWLWLRPRLGGGYWISPTPLGCSEARRWSQRKAKEAALQFGAPLA